MMNDLISRQAAIDALVSMTIYTKEELKEYREESAYKDCWTNGIYDAVEKIEKLPPIQPKLLQPWEVLAAQAVLPQPEIIYCKDCGHRDDHGCCKYWRGLAMSETPIATDDYDFCKHARRREREH